MREDLKALRIDKEQRGESDRGGNPWFWLSLVLLLCLGGLAAWIYFSGALNGEEGPVVEAADVAGDRPAEPPREVIPPVTREVLVASGYIVAHHTHELASKVSGKVEWIGVEKGDRVEKGQLLVKLEDKEFRAQLAQAEAQLRAAQERLAELEAGSRPEEIERAEAELERAETERELAARDLERIRKLYERGIVARQELDNAEARLRRAAADVQVAAKNLELLRRGPREEQIRQARAEVEHWKAAVDYAAAMLEATEIRAPVSGTVLRRIAEIGEMVTTSYAGGGGAQSATVALADLSDLQVELDISQMDFNRLSPDLECVMVPEAYPDREYRCAIDEISPEANRQKASIQVKVKILEPDEYLRPEMSARVTFLRPEDEKHE
ncbi:MAG: efflux RND transporter periplasmic adaptor subunit [Acidobacteriota bacterium]